MARTVQEWERTVTPEQYREPLDQDTRRLYGGKRSISVFRYTQFEISFEYRAWKRMEGRADYGDLCEARQVHFLRKYDSAAYQMYELRREVASLKAQIDGGRESN